MAHAKEKGLKDFLISIRDSVGSSVTNAPFWVMQKTRKRMYNKRQKRHWRDTDLGKLYRKKKAKSGPKDWKKKSGWKPKKLVKTNKRKKKRFHKYTRSD
ncbi:MAG: hypothetical protein V1494_03335 [Candidatus Diapherotrites archaeon]